MTRAVRHNITGMDATTRLGEALALFLRPGDTLCFYGDLGSGKTTLIRALVRAFCDQPALDVPSPTYTLAQVYEGAGGRFGLCHADLYRLGAPRDVEELDLFSQLDKGALLVEWPDRWGADVPPARLDIHLTLEGEQREATLSTPSATMQLRLDRLQMLRAFLDSTPFAGAQRRFLQGDASPRAYERLTLGTSAGTQHAVLLNARAQPDRSVGAARLKYMAITHLAPNDAITPVLAIGEELRARGFSIPRHLAFDLEQSLLLQEDFGYEFIAVNGTPVEERYHGAIDALVHLHLQSWPDAAKAPAGVTHLIPPYSEAAFLTEASLFTAYFLPLMLRRPPTATVTHSFLDAFKNLYAQLNDAPTSWTLFDFHSPNAMWLPARAGVARIGILDFQDTRRGPQAYDVVSLAQDARVTVLPALEQDLKTRYRTALSHAQTAFDGDAFERAYAICGAQRATRILGVFARLALQDSKPHYLQHVPRVSGYLDRCLASPGLQGLKAWFEAHAPASERLQGPRAA